MPEPVKTTSFPWPTLAFAAGPFIFAATKRWGLGPIGGAALVALGVGLLAAALVGVLFVLGFRQKASAFAWGLGGGLAGALGAFLASLLP